MKISIKEIKKKIENIENKSQWIKIGVVVVLLVVFLFVFFFKTGDNKEPPPLEPQKEVEERVEGKEKTIVVDISGEVNNSGVVELKQGSRVEDAINAADGLTDKANLKQVNRASLLEDGDKIFIPSVEGGEATGGVTTSEENVKINLNTATTSQLETLSGIGPATAEKILLYRSTKGHFLDIEDIKNVDGIGEKTFEQIKGNITI